MPIDTRNSKILAAARAAIKAGDLPKAQNYLLMAEGEEAEKLLDRVNKAIAARGSGKAKHESVAQVTSEAVAAGIKQAEKEKEVAKAKVAAKGMQGCLIFIVMLTICIIAFFVSIQPSADKSRDAICRDALRGTPEGTRCVLDQFPNEMQICHDRFLYVYQNTIDIWYDCLRDQGVTTNMLDFPN